MLGRIFARRPAEISVSDAARALGAAGRSDDRARRRAMCDQIRADLRAKGREDMQPIDWAAL